MDMTKLRLYTFGSNRKSAEAVMTPKVPPAVSLGHFWCTFLSGSEPPKSVSVIGAHTCGAKCDFVISIFHVCGPTHKQINGNYVYTHLEAIGRARRLLDHRKCPRLSVWDTFGVSFGPEVDLKVLLVILTLGKFILP